MEVLIIEDEPLAATHLQTLLKEINPKIKVIQVLDSVQGAVKWFKNNTPPQLIFMDVHLGDGLCFEIFKAVKISSFVIFTTAYDQYALQAFKVNSVDYLLKPIDKAVLGNALDKYNNFAGNVEGRISDPAISKLLNAIQNNSKNYKDRFIVKVGTHIRMVKTEEISCFYSRDKATYLVSQTGKQYMVDFALEKLLELLNPAKFFRVSRQCIVELGSISDVVTLGPLRIKVKMVGYPEEVLVSRDKIKSFKNWLEG